jgi:hypothetical protein
VTEPRLSVPSPSLCIRTESVSTAELLLKGAAAAGAFDRHLEGLATFRHRLLIRGSLVRSQLGEPISQRVRRRAGYPVRPFGALPSLVFTAPALHLPSEQTWPKHLRRKSRVDAIEHARVLVAHGRRAEFVGDAVRAEPGAAQIVRRAARDAGAGAGGLQRLPELGTRQEEAPLAPLGVLEREDSPPPTRAGTAGTS